MGGIWGNCQSVKWHALRIKTRGALDPNARKEPARSRRCSSEQGPFGRSFYDEESEVEDIGVVCRRVSVRTGRLRRKCVKVVFVYFGFRKLEPGLVAQYSCSCLEIPKLSMARSAHHEH